MWSLRDFKLLSTITGGHKRSVRSVAWKDYGSNTAAAVPGKKPVTLATGSFDANVGIWVHNDQQGSRAYDVDMDELDVGKRDSEEEEWSFSTLLTGPDSEIKSVKFSPPHYGTNLLATSSRDKSVWVWEEVEEDEWETIAVLNEHAGDVKCVEWCAGGRKRRRLGNDEEGDVMGGRELLASGGYDDTIRLWKDVEEEGDWVCVGVIEGHGGTVWDLSWERMINDAFVGEEEMEDWEPRIASCSDDLTIRIWKRELSEREKEKKRQGRSTSGPRLPSIIRPASNLETWVEDARLPEAHLRSVYAVDWSASTGLIVSGGGDGTIAVYKELSDETSEKQDVVMNGTSEHGDEQKSASDRKQTKWVIAAMLEAAHDEYEINHVCWAERRDKGRNFEGEEVIVSTGDDGDVRIWTLPDEVVAGLRR